MRGRPVLGGPGRAVGPRRRGAGSPGVLRGDVPVSGKGLLWHFLCGTCRLPVRVRSAPEEPARTLRSGSCAHQRGLEQGVGVTPENGSPDLGFVLSAPGRVGVRIFKQLPLGHTVVFVDHADVPFRVTELFES